MQWEAVGEIRDKARKLQLATKQNLVSHMLRAIHALISLISCPQFQLYKLYTSRILYAYKIEVALPGNEIDRDAVIHNVKVLTLAAKVLGLRVGVRTCQVHVEALYAYMGISAPRNFSQFSVACFSHPHAHSH